jgi:hypothetical protein
LLRLLPLLVVVALQNGNKILLSLQH